MKTQIAGLVCGAALATQVYGAPLAGCYEIDPPGMWAELLLNGQAGSVGNQISAWDDATYEFSGATLAEVQADTTGEWDWITKYQGGTLVLSNVLGAGWFTPCESEGETVVSFSEVWVKTRSTRYETNEPGKLEFQLEAVSGPYSIVATYSGVPTLTQQDSNYVASAALTSAEICIGARVRMNVCQSSLNLKSRGVMPVIVYGSAESNVGDLDFARIKLECVPALRYAISDVNQDGYPDMLLKFSTPAIAPGLMDIPDKTTTTLIMTAALKDGTPIAATDNVRILNKTKPAKPAPKGKAKGRK